MGPATKADQDPGMNVNTRQEVKWIQEDISNHGYALCNGLVLTALTANT